MGSTLSVRLVVRRATHPLNATMVHLPVSTPTSCTTLTPHHKETHTTNTHSSGLRSYSNPSYKKCSTQRQSSMPARGYQYRATYTLPPPQPKSSLESLMEQFIATQTKTNEALSSSINPLTSKFDAIIVHQRVMDTQIAQIA